MWHHGYGWTGGYGGTAMMAVSILFWLLVISGIVLLIVRLVRQSNHGRVWHDREPDALEIARRRYAKGEISKEQFEQLKRDLAP